MIMHGGGGEIGKYTPEEGQETRLPESTCDIVNLFCQNISVKCEGQAQGGLAIVFVNIFIGGEIVRQSVNALRW